MTTDPFTTAARRHSRELWTMLDQRIASEEAAHWARDHLAAQEPTDDAVEAVARHTYWHAATFHTNESWEREPVARKNVYRNNARAALVLAKEATR